MSSFLDFTGDSMTHESIFGRKYKFLIISMAVVGDSWILDIPSNLIS